MRPAIYCAEVTGVTDAQIKASSDEGFGNSNGASGRSRRRSSSATPAPSSEASAVREFTLTAGGKTYAFVAESEEELARWVQALRTVQAAHVPTVASDRAGC